MFDDIKYSESRIIQKIVLCAAVMIFSFSEVCVLYASAQTNPVLKMENDTFSSETVTPESLKFNPTSSQKIMLVKREHPFLFADASQLKAISAKARKHSWAHEQLDKLLEHANAAVKEPLEIPEEGGQWSGHYACKQCGDRLSYKHGKHVCPKCSAEYTGWPYDQVRFSRIHNNNWDNIQRLGIAYGITGDERYAVKAREILIGYASRYESYRIHDYMNGTLKKGARVFAQTLDESYNIIGVAWGYDLIYNSPCLSDDDRRNIEEHLLRPGVGVIHRNNMGISNWQSWHNAAIAAVGCCLQDSEMVSEALYGKGGLVFQLENSLLEGGFWYEGSPAYHFYALDAIRWTAEAAYNAGIDFWKDPRLLSLYNAYIAYAFPDGLLPATNDSDPMPLMHRLYEVVYYRCQDSAYVPVIQAGKRASLEALMWGVEELPDVPPTLPESQNFPGIGAVMLRQGEGEKQICVHLDYGPHGGYHGHNDKLALIFFGLGAVLAPDPARVSYGTPLHRGWYSTTFAHNTVCVDQENQKQTEGALTCLVTEPGLTYAEATCDTAYPGVRMTRYLALTEDYLIDIYEVGSETGHTYDWVWHAYGTVSSDIPFSPVEESPGTKNGYQYFEDVTQVKTDDMWSVDFHQEKGALRLTMLGGVDTRIFSGVGMAENPPKPCPMLIARRNTNSTRFVAVFEPYDKEATVKDIRLEQTGDTALVVSLRNGDAQDTLTLNLDMRVVTESQQSPVRAVFKRQFPQKDPVTIPITYNR